MLRSDCVKCAKGKWGPHTGAVSEEAAGKRDQVRRATVACCGNSPVGRYQSSDAIIYNRILLAKD